MSVRGIQGQMRIWKNAMGRRCRSALTLATIITVGGLAVSATAQSQNPTPPESYRPGLGDMMTMTVQPRHTKLWRAGSQKNWLYADYELHELQEAFDRAAAVWPTWRSQPIAQMITGNVQEPIAAIERAIKAADIEKFTAAYKQLTDACDSCHQGAGRAMIVIKVPDSTMFPDQDFAPALK